MVTLITSIYETFMLGFNVFIQDLIRIGCVGTQLTPVAVLASIARVTTNIPSVGLHWIPAGELTTQAPPSQGGALLDLKEKLEHFRNFTRTRFSFPDFTRKCVNYANSKSRQNSKYNISAITI